MDMNGWKKWIWVVLFFSLALNFGFVFTAVSWKFQPRFTPPPPGMGPMRPGPGHGGPGGPQPFFSILDRMDLTEDVREKVKVHLGQMAEDHRQLIDHLFEREKNILELIGRPGDVNMETVAPLIESYSRVRQQSALNKARHIIEIRKLLGREKSVYLISELKKEFDRFHKRAPWDKPQD